MDGKSLNLTQELLEQLQAIIPQAFSEGKLDTTALKTLLGEEVFVQGERYGLSWAGKSDAYKVLQQQTTTTLIPEPEQSVDWDNAQHVFIEGENLEVLKLLQKSYFGQVKMIYIDPPYNTGSDSFIYPDKFSETKEEYLQRIGDKNDEGYMLREGAFRPNRKESGQYHSNWLNMMLPRLYLARNLLRDDGVIFVSIGDHEVGNLVLLLDEIFGVENKCAMFSWKSRAKPTNAGEAKFRPQKVSEYVLCYAKTDGEKQKFNVSSAKDRVYPHEDERGKFRTTTILTSNRGMFKRETMRFEVAGFKPDEDKRWKAGYDEITKAYEEGRLGFGDEGIPYLKHYIDEESEALYPLYTFVDENLSGTAETGKSDLNQLIGNNHDFDTVKPVNLLRYLIASTVSSNDLILDFFAGSGTTAQAVMELNEEDGGNRRYICVQLPEKTDENSEAAKAGYTTIADITAARIKKVIAKIEVERATKIDLLNENKPLPNLGFRKFTLAPSNFKLWRGDVIESEEDLLRQMRLFATPQRANVTTPDMAWELLLKSGYDLTEAVTVLTLDDGLKVYHTADKRLALVLDGFSPAVQTTVLQLKPKQVILLDSVFAGRDNGDSLKTNAQLTFEDQGIAFKTV